MSEFDELPETFDPSAHEGTRDLECIPPGWYQAQMIENEVRDAINGNGTYLLAVFRNPGRRIPGPQNLPERHAAEPESTGGRDRPTTADRHLQRGRHHDADQRYSRDAVQAGHGARGHQAGQGRRLPGSQLHYLGKAAGLSTEAGAQWSADWSSHELQADGAQAVHIEPAAPRGDAPWR